jgi:arylformamidase
MSKNYAQHSNFSTGGLMDFFDISRPLGPRSVTFPGDLPLEITIDSDVSRGDLATVSHFCASTHVGTHVDPPRHLFPDARAIDELPLSAMIGPAHVVDVSDRIITADVLKAAGIPPEIPRILFRTHDGSLWKQPGYQADHPYLDESAANWLVATRTRLVGIDYLSVDGGNAPTLPVHRTLLAGGAIILEGLDLSDIRPGSYQLICLPLRLVGADGAPARAVLAPLGWST